MTSQVWVQGGVLSLASVALSHGSLLGIQLLASHGAVGGSTQAAQSKVWLPTVW